MVEAKISERAQKILALIANEQEIPIRQQALAELLGCSRRSIGRALKELKDAGLLVDLNKRHANRCKIYLLTPRLQQASEIKTIIPSDPEGLWLPQPGPMRPVRVDDGPGERQLKLYRFTFESNFREWPDWEKYYPQVIWELRNEMNADALFRQTFDRLYAIQAQL